MENLVDLGMIVCFLTSLFFVVANITGGFLFKGIAKLVGIVGVMIPLIYLFIKLGYI
jgi:hypothetical protein